MGFRVTPPPPRQSNFLPAKTLEMPQGKGQIFKKKRI